MEPLADNSPEGPADSNSAGPADKSSAVARLAANSPAAKPLNSMGRHRPDACSRSHRRSQADPLGQAGVLIVERSANNCATNEGRNIGEGRCGSDRTYERREHHGAHNSPKNFLMCPQGKPIHSPVTLYRRSGGAPVTSSRALSWNAGPRTKQSRAAAA